MYHHISISWGIPMRIQLVCPESREALNGHGAKGSAERSKSTASGCSVGPMARSGSYLMMRLKALSETHGTQAVARTTSTATICIILRLCMELHVMLVWACLSLENKLMSVFQAASTSKKCGNGSKPRYTLVSHQNYCLWICIPGKILRFEPQLQRSAPSVARLKHHSNCLFFNVRHL